MAIESKPQRTGGSPDLQAAGGENNRTGAAETVLSVQGVKKKIKGKWIIHDVGFEIRAGEIFGFLGPNGSGKTTTIRMLVGLIRPTEGAITVCGYRVDKDFEEAMKRIGCIVENPEVYTYLSGWENLTHFARMQEGVDENRIREVVEIVRLSPRIHDKVRTYSLGMRQRLGIAQALLGRPRLLILDEPTNGLDPKGIKELREFIRMLSDQGLSLFISSHLLSEIQLMCDRVAIINAGRVLAVGTVDELIREAGAYVLWQLDRPAEGRRLLECEPKLKLVGDDEHRIDAGILASMPGAIVTMIPEEAIPQMVSRLVGAGIGVLAVQKVAPTLEELFLNMTEDDGLA